MPLFLRPSSDEWLEGSEIEKEAGGSWNVDPTARFARKLPDLGLDLLNSSPGGNHHAKDTKAFRIKDYQTRSVKRIRQEVKAEGKQLFIGAVGLTTEAKQARDLMEDGL